MSIPKAKNALYRVYRQTGVAEGVLSHRGQGLTILAYHGICDEALRAEPWVPSFFLGSDSFQEHLKFFATECSPISLRDGIRKLREGESLPPRAVALTFDDGYANNLSIAAPLLKNYGVPATVFVSTRNIESGAYFHFDKVRIIELQSGKPCCPEFKQLSIDEVLELLRESWESVEGRLTASQRDTLRPMTLAEVGELNSELIEIGAHTQSHCILSNETQDRRRTEILGSLQRVRDWVGIKEPIFSYPNGQIGDFGACDVELLRSVATGAVTTISGFNRPGADVFQLQRYPVSIHHDKDTILAEITGFRWLISRVLRRDKQERDYFQARMGAV